ncbi:hypothetical protein EDD16DRAFT_1498680, partial [Pisolithus croceorrhizus]
TPWLDENVLYRLHGGGYVKLSRASHGLHHKCHSHGVSKHSLSISRTFSIEYRLSTAEPYKVKHHSYWMEIAGYNYLVNGIGFDPSKIITLGDPAG